MVVSWDRVDLATATSLLLANKFVGTELLDGPDLVDLSDGESRYDSNG